MTESEFKAWTAEIDANTKKLKEMSETIREKNTFFGILMLWAILFTIFAFGFAIQRSSFRDGAIKRGYMMYNPTNSHLMWVEGLTSTNK